MDDLRKILAVEMAKDKVKRKASRQQQKNAADSQYNQGEQSMREPLANAEDSFRKIDTQYYGMSSSKATGFDSTDLFRKGNQNGRPSRLVGRTQTTHAKNLNKRNSVQVQLNMRALQEQDYSCDSSHSLSESSKSPKSATNASQKMKKQMKATKAPKKRSPSGNRRRTSVPVVLGGEAKDLDLGVSMQKRDFAKHHVEQIVNSDLALVRKSTRRSFFTSMATQNKLGQRLKPNKADNNNSGNNSSGAKRHQGKKPRIESFEDAVDSCLQVQQTGIGGTKAAQSPQDVHKNGGGDKGESPSQNEQNSQKEELSIPPIQQRASEQQNSNGVGIVIEPASKSNSKLSARRKSIEPASSSSMSDDSSSSSSIREAKPKNGEASGNQTSACIKIANLGSIEDSQSNTPQDSSSNVRGSMRSIDRKMNRAQSEEYPQKLGPIFKNSNSPLKKLQTAVGRSVGGIGIGTPGNPNSKKQIDQIRSMKTMVVGAKKPQMRASGSSVQAGSDLGAKEIPKFKPISQMELLKKSSPEMSLNLEESPGIKEEKKLESQAGLQREKTFQDVCRQNSLDVQDSNVQKKSSFTDKLERSSSKRRFQKDGATTAQGAIDNQDFLLTQNEIDSPITVVKRKKCLFYPQDRMKQVWDLICGLCLIISCLTIPFYLAIYFDEDEKKSSIYINAVVDTCFFLDIIATFNTAVPVSQVKIEEDRKQIAKMYLKKWFWIDLLVTLPYDQLISLYNPQFTNVVTLSKFVRIMKIVRLIRLIKLVKVAKDRKKMAAILASSLQLNYAIERLVLSIFGFLLLCHVIACIWILQVKLDESVTSKNWIEEKGFQHAGDWELYFAAYYFSVTTFTTVGYGDIHATCTNERIMAIFLMIGGVFAFSFATGTLTSILTSLDATNKQVNEKMLVVNKLSQRYNLDDEIKSKLHATVRFQIQNSTDEFTEFLSQLDPRLRQRVYREMYKLTQKKISFFQKKTDQNFIEWICPLLKVIILISDMPVYREQEEIQAIYFLEQGEAAYVLPRYQNAPFVTICASETFGLIDIMFRMMETDDDSKKDQDRYTEQKLMRHKFTCHTQKNSIILQFSMEDLKRMELEYREVYEELFDDQDLLLERALEQKAKAQHHLEAFDEIESQVSPAKVTKRGKHGRESKHRHHGKRQRHLRSNSVSVSIESSKHGSSLYHNEGSIQFDSPEQVQAAILQSQQSQSPENESLAKLFELGKNNNVLTSHMTDSGELGLQSEFSTPPQAVQILAPVDERSDEIDESDASSFKNSDDSYNDSQMRDNQGNLRETAAEEGKSSAGRHSKDGWGSSDSSDGGNPKDGNGGNVKGAASPKQDHQEQQLTQNNMNNVTSSIDNLLSQSVQIHSSPPVNKRQLETMHSGFYSQGPVQSGNMNTSIISNKDRDRTSSSQKNISQSSKKKKEQKDKDDKDDEAKVIEQMRKQRNTGQKGSMKRRFSLMPKQQQAIGSGSGTNFSLDQQLGMSQRTHNNSLPFLSNRSDSLMMQQQIMAANNQQQLQFDLQNASPLPYQMRKGDVFRFDRQSMVPPIQTHPLSLGGVANLQPNPNKLPSMMQNTSTDANNISADLNAQLQKLQADFQKQLNQVVQQFQINPAQMQNQKSKTFSPIRPEQPHLLSVPRMPPKSKSISLKSINSAIVSEKNISQEESSKSHKSSSARSPNSKIMANYDAFETESSKKSASLSGEERKGGKIYKNPSSMSRANSNILTIDPEAKVTAIISPETKSPTRSKSFK